MATDILDKLTDQEIFNIIHVATGGEMCAKGCKNSIVRGEVYTVKSSSKRFFDKIIGCPKYVIEFTDEEVEFYNGGFLMPLINKKFNSAMQDEAQKEEKTKSL